MPVVFCRGKTQLYHKYRYRAKKKGFKWALTLNQFCEIITQVCHYCGKAPGKRRVHTGGRVYETVAVGVDRKSSRRGYTILNSLPCCWNCNSMKSQMGYAKFLKKVGAIWRWRAGGDDDK